MADPRTIWQFNTTAHFWEFAAEDYQTRFDGEYQYTKDVVLGATTSAQSYIDLGAFVVAPMTKKIEFATSAERQAFQGMIGTTATLSNDHGLSYTAVLLRVTRIEGAGMWRADALWEAR